MIVDIVDDLPFTGPGLIRLARQRGVDLSGGVLANDWVSFGSRWTFDERTVVVSAELVDHVPVVLKVRAMDRVGARPIVLMAVEHEAVRQRLLEAGARTVLSRDAGFEPLLEALLRVAGSKNKPRRPAPDPKVPQLTDRELQISTLFCGTAAPSGTRLAQLLGLSNETVRVHLARARRRYRETGADVSAREDFRRQLIKDGWLIESI